MALGAALAAPAGAATLLDFSVYSLGDYASSGGGSTIDGRVAVAGNASINAESIGAGLTSAASQTPVVIAGGNLSYDNSTLRYGSVVYGGANNSGQWTQVQTPNGTVTQGNPLDFSSLNDIASGYSTSLSRLDANGAFSALYGAGTLTASSSGLNVFFLNAADLASVSSLKLVGDSGGKVVINVDASDISKHLSFDMGGYASDSVLFNFYNASNVALGGWQFGGSVLAPDALVTLRGSSILGNIVAGDFQSAGSHVGGNGYAGYFDAGRLSAIPEPDTWLMLLAGFTLAGIMIRRRRRQSSVASVVA